MKQPDAPPTTSLTWDEKGWTKKGGGEKHNTKYYDVKIAIPTGLCYDMLGHYLAKEQRTRGAGRMYNNGAQKKKRKTRDRWRPPFAFLAFAFCSLSPSVH